jgi:hypothetical protein
MAFAPLPISQVDKIATHGFGLKTIKPSVRFSMSSSNRENDFIGAVPSLHAELRMKHPHETERSARQDAPRPSLAQTRQSLREVAHFTCSGRAPELLAIGV